MAAVVEIMAMAAPAKARLCRTAQDVLAGPNVKVDRAPVARIVDGRRHQGRQTWIMTTSQLRRKWNGKYYLLH